MVQMIVKDSVLIIFTTLPTMIPVSPRACMPCFYCAVVLIWTLCAQQKHPISLLQRIMAWMGMREPQTAKVVKSKPLSESHDSGTQKVRYASEVDTVIAPSLGLCSPPTTRPGQHANLHDKLLRPRGAKPRMFVEQRELARDMPMRLQFRYLTYAWPAARCPVELSGLGTPALRLLPEMR